MNIFSNTATEITTTITSTITTISINNNNNNNNNNRNVSSAVLSASLTFRCGLSLGCNEGDGFQVWKLASNILNNLLQISDKGCLLVWWLGELLTTKHLNSLFIRKYFTKLRNGTDCGNVMRLVNWR